MITVVCNDFIMFIIQKEAQSGNQHFHKQHTG